MVCPGFHRAISSFHHPGSPCLPLGTLQGLQWLQVRGSPFQLHVGGQLRTYYLSTKHMQHTSALRMQKRAAAHLQIWACLQGWIIHSRQVSQDWITQSRQVSQAWHIGVQELWSSGRIQHKVHELCACMQEK